MRLHDKHYVLYLPFRTIYCLCYCILSFRELLKAILQNKDSDFLFYFSDIKKKRFLTLDLVIK